MASAFAAAFVWVAIDAFGVRVDIVVEFFMFSVGMVLVMVCCALPVGLLLRFFRRRSKRLSFESTSVEVTSKKTDSE